MDGITVNLQAGMAAARAGQKDQARAYFLQVLADDSRNETAWLWLSGVMPTAQQALHCVEQLLALNPTHPRALDARAVLRVQLLVEEVAGEQVAPSVLQRRYLLGEALVEARVITQQQLDEALRHQAALMKQQPVRLGDVLVRLKMVSREQLDAALAAQIDSMNALHPDTHPHGFGDFLVHQHVITRAQLHQGLARQAALKHHGQPTPLGEVLIQCGYLERLMLHPLLLEWHHQMIVQTNPRRCSDQ